MTQMIEVKTADLVGRALDWAVAGGASDTPYWARMFQICVLTGKTHGGIDFKYAPSECWSQGGLLIDKHLLSLKMTGTETWAAIVEGCNGIDPTPLIAACRAIVAAKLGDVVSVPAELA